MKRKLTILTIAVLVLGMATVANAGNNTNTDFGYTTYTRLWDATDSTATLKTIDTTYSKVLTLGLDPRVLFFSVQTISDTDFTADSLYLMLQHSCDQINWITYPTAINVLPLKSADLDTVFQSTLRLRLDSILTAPVFIQNYIRIMGIYWDSTEADAAGLFGNSYHFKWNVYLRTVK